MDKRVHALFDILRLDVLQASFGTEEDSQSRHLAQSLANVDDDDDVPSQEFDVICVKTSPVQGSRLVRSLCSRVRRCLSVDALGSSLSAQSFPSQAASIHFGGQLFDQVAPFSVAHWPNLQSLSLVGHLRMQVPGTQGRFSLVDLIPQLPATLTSLSVKEQGGRFYNSAPDGPSPSFVTLHLPNLTHLDMCEYPIISPLEGTSAWPSNLTSLVLMVVPRERVQQIDLCLPQSLTSLELGLFCVHSQCTPFLVASQLPFNLKYLEAPLVTLGYDAPLPPEIESVRCRVFSPNYDESAFPLPSTLTSLHPKPSPSVAANHGPNIRIIAGLALSSDVSLTNEDAVEWLRLEKMVIAYCTKNAPNRSGVRQDDALEHNVVRTHMASISIAFQRHVSFPFSNLVCERWLALNILEVTIERVSRTLIRAHSLESAAITRGVLSHARFLSSIHLSSEQATEVFLDVAVQSFAPPSPTRPKLPHLLSNSTITINGRRLVTKIKSIVVEHPRVQLTNITALTVNMILSHLSSSETGKAIAHLFPRVKSLNIYYAEEAYCAGHDRPHSTHLLPALEGMPNLETFSLWPQRMLGGKDMFTELPSKFVDVMPPHIETVHVTMGARSASRTHGEVVNLWG
jgi:hypothetical protein